MLFDNLIPLTGTYRVTKHGLMDRLNTDMTQEVVKIQDEFFRVYNEGDLNELARFDKELDVIAESYRAQSLH